MTERQRDILEVALSYAWSHRDDAFESYDAFLDPVTKEELDELERLLVGEYVVLEDDGEVN